MENKQSIIVDTDLLNKILERKLEDYLKRKEKSIDAYITKKVRDTVEAKVYDTTEVSDNLVEALDYKNPESILSKALLIKAKSEIDKKVNTVSSSEWHNLFHKALKDLVINNISFSRIINSIIREIVIEDANFKKVIQGFVEVSFKSKIEKYLKKTSHTLSDGA